VQTRKTSKTCQGARRPMMPQRPAAAARGSVQAGRPVGGWLTAVASRNEITRGGQLCSARKLSLPYFNARDSPWSTFS
jgi:hypothetical protein